jgi:hypothetical protein
MPTIGSKVSQKELEAIAEYANLCGETVPNLIRKVMIAHATLLDGGYVNEHPEYECDLMMPGNLSSEEEKKMLEEKINRVRRILGWKDIRL